MQLRLLARAEVIVIRNAKVETRAETPPLQFGAALHRGEKGEGSEHDDT